MIGTGERSQFGEVFKMMQAEEVRAVGALVFWEVGVCDSSWLRHGPCPLLRNENDVVNVSS